MIAPTREQIRTGVFILLPVVVFFALLEFGFRGAELFHPPMTVDLGQGFGEESRLFLRHDKDPRMLTTNPDKRMSFDSESFPIRKSKGTFRAFWLGGSSINLIEFIFEPLEQRLLADYPEYDSFQIISCGGMSYGSHRLVLVLREVLQYDPDLIILYTGNNEFEDLEQMHLAHLGTVPVQRTLGKLAIYRFIRDWVARRQIAALEADSAERAIATSVPDSTRTWFYIFSKEEIAERMENFETNIDTMMGLCDEQGVPMIIGTVPSNLIEPELYDMYGDAFEAEVKPLYAAGKYAEGKARAEAILAKAPRHQSSPAENAIIRRLAAKWAVPVADVEQRVTLSEPHEVPGETLFNDHCHLSPEGIVLLVDTVEKTIRQVLDDAG